MTRLTAIELYTLQIVSDGTPLEKLDRGLVHTAVLESEQNLTDLLPDGYRAIIRPWNQPDEAADDA